MSECLVWEFPDSGMRDELEDSSDANEFSEHELLDIMYNACNASSTGELATMNTGTDSQKVCTIRSILSLPIRRGVSVVHHTIPA